MSHVTEMAPDVDNATMPTLHGDNSNILANQSMLRKMNDDEVKRLIPTIIYLALLSVIGIIGNSLVCHVYRTRYRLSNSQCFILCLSAIDLFSCCIVIPLEIATIVDQYTFEYLWLCKLSRFFNTLGTLSSSFLLLFIAIDRYRKVCRPFGWQIKANVAKFLCVLSVLLGLLFSWPAIFIYGKQRFDIPEFGLTGTECSTDDAMLNTIFPLINSAVFGGLFIVGIISICILYCFIGREVKRHAKRMPKELSIRNTSIPMLSSTIDGRDSRISGEIDANILAKYDMTKIKRESKKKSFSKRRSRKADSESSWADRNDFELSCSMDCSVKDTSIVLSDKGKEKDEDVQSDDSGIKSDQTNKDENGDSCNKDSVEDREADDSDLENTDCDHKNVDAGEIEHSVNVEIQNKLNRLEPVNEDEHSADQTPEPETETKEDTSPKQSIVETERKISELSQSSESMKPRSIRARMSSIGSLLSSAVVRRMTSLVSGTSTGSTAIKTHYLKQARARKTAFLMFLISLAFVLSYMPHLLLMIIRQLVNNFIENMSKDGRAVYKFFLRSYFLNCAINPVIYGVCDSRFRTACKEIFSRCCNRGESRDFN